MLTPTHVLISLVALGAGLSVTRRLLLNRRVDAVHTLFLWTTMATSITGFVFFPIVRLLPSHGVGLVSILVLALAWAGRRQSFRGAWRPMYVIGVLTGFYLNVFVLIVQIFLKVPAAAALAPTQSEPPFLLSQAAMLGVFVAVGRVALRRFQPPSLPSSSR